MIVKGTKIYQSPNDVVIKRRENLPFLHNGRQKKKKTTHKITKKNKHTH